MRLLLTGVTGKVGQAFLPAFLEAPEFSGASVVALCNNRTIPETERVSVIKGSINDPAVIEAALDGVTHVIHMAAVKESPELVIDVSIKGMFLLLEQFRQSAEARQFVLIGGDCSVGHFFHDYPDPITETAPRRAYQGCYALTKVIEEVMLEQYGIQYGINHCCLRAPWIMEKDDFKFAFSFGPDQFGGPGWDTLIDPVELGQYSGGGYVPLMHDHSGAALKRNFVHVDDLVAAMLASLDHPGAMGQTFNIAMDEPVDYARAAIQISEKYGLKPVEIPTPFHSNWLANTKARHVLGWAPEVRLETMIERAFNFERGAEEPRKIWYPG